MMTPAPLLATFLGVLTFQATAFAQATSETVEENRLTQLATLRSTLTNQLHLQAYELIDEMVYEWKERPLFEQPTEVVVASVNAPIGYGAGLMTLLENHLYAVILENQDTNIDLVECSACSDMVVHSGSEATVISRGIDQPRALDRILPRLPAYALHLDLEAEGAALVLRARLTKLDQGQRIHWARAYTPTVGSTALLRSNQRLISAEEARQEYLDLLRGDEVIMIPFRLGLHSFASGENNTINPPLFMLQTGIELSPTFARAWSASFLGGIIYLPDTYIGMIGQTRIYRLITGNHRSIAGPDLYFFVGADIITVSGEAIVSLKPEETSFADLLVATNPEIKPRATFGGFQVGLELRVNNRIGLTAGLKTIPSLRDSSNMGRFFRSNIVDFHSLTTEVAFWY